MLQAHVVAQLDRPLYDAITTLATECYQQIHPSDTNQEHLLRQHIQNELESMLAHQKAASSQLDQFKRGLIDGGELDHDDVRLMQSYQRTNVIPIVWNTRTSHLHRVLPSGQGKITPRRRKDSMKSMEMRDTTTLLMSYEAQQLTNRITDLMFQDLVNEMNTM